MTMEKNGVEANGINKVTHKAMNGLHKTDNKLKYRLPEKTLKVRDSIFTQLMEQIPEVRQTYNIVLCFILSIIFTAVARDLLTKGRLGYVFTILYYQFGKFKTTSLLWIGAHISTGFIFLCFKIWATIRFQLSPKNYKQWDLAWISVFTAYYLWTFYYTISLIKLYDLPVGSRLFFAIESLRLLMKLHAFVRTKVPEILRYKPYSDETLKLPEFSKFLYFLFAPTLIYKDEYPRTETIRWTFVITNLVETAMCLFLAGMVICHLSDLYNNFYMDNNTLSDNLVLLLFETGFPGFMLGTLVYYITLHSVQNFFAEILRFGDRLFYDDWWAHTSYHVFFRKWNILVGDFLYTYLYSDFYTHVMPGNKAMAQLLTFGISSLAHEWLIMAALGHFFPILSLYFFVGALISLYVRPPQNKYLNVIFLYLYQFGVGQVMAFHSMEYLSRIKGVHQFPFSTEIFPVKFQQLND